MTNSITIVGSLGRDPELRFTQSGIAVASFSVAVNRRKKVNDEWEDETVWFNVTAWRELAENVASSLSKGDRVICMGYMKDESYEDKEGNKRDKMGLQADAVGAELRFAQVTVERTTRTKGERSGGGGGGRSDEGEEPFIRHARLSDL